MQDELQSISFSYYKSFHSDHMETIDLTAPICLIIGRNNSGKSSLIDILEFVYNKKICDRLLGTLTEIQPTFSLSEKHLLAFSQNTRGGGIPGESHYAYAQQFVGYSIQTKLNTFINTHYTGERYTERALEFKGLIKDNQMIDVYGTDYWERTVKTYEDFANAIEFRRINADRNIIPEPEDKALNVGYGGDGTTNLIRQFLNNSEFDEKEVEEQLLFELNSIMGKDACFESIRIQQITQDDGSLWEIFLKEKGQNRFALSKSGSGLKTILLMLVNLLLLPKIPKKQNRTFVFAFEELENNLHPALQRRVFEYLYSYAKTHNVRIFLTSHSHVAINVFYGKELARICHVTKEDGISRLKYIDSYMDKAELLEDLDVKASDILQSNGIIWVEGPSDRIYIKRWLSLFTENKYIEGKDYQFLYYGGRLLAHYDASSDESIEGLISILTTNRNAVVVIDSDKKYRSAPINKTKTRIQNELVKKGYTCWITKGKEIENYLTARSIKKAYNLDLEHDIEQYELFPEYIKKIIPNFSSQKVQVAKKISNCITVDDARFDLKKQIEQIYKDIQRWNS